MSDEQGGFSHIEFAIAFYNTGTIWAHEIDIFRTWKLIDPKSFPVVQKSHWRKLPFWIFTPVGFSFAGSVALSWYHPANISIGLIWLAFGTQFLSHLLTVLLWGPWQAKLSRDTLAGKSVYLEKILRTHWIRTTLITLYSFILLYMMVKVVE